MMMFDVLKSYLYFASEFSMFSLKIRHNFEKNKIILNIFEKFDKVKLFEMELFAG